MMNATDPDEIAHHREGRTCHLSARDFVFDGGHPRDRSVNGELAKLETPREEAVAFPGHDLVIRVSWVIRPAAQHFRWIVGKACENLR
ncbi:MAG: hypothetical protein H7A49_06515 [Akkermansiaceae bacterium]|nr:hypothetical protein [Akkermansiaceae bacterium]